MVNQLDFSNLMIKPPSQGSTFDYAKQRSRNQELAQQVSQEQLNQRLIEVLEEEKSENERGRSNSPGDAFHDAFTQYGMKLGPELMRLSMESANEDDDSNDADNCDKKSSDGQLTDSEEREENDFIAEQRYTSKKSNPASG